MSQLKFNVKVGDNIVFLGKTDSSFVENGKYKILTIDKLCEYPFNDKVYFDLSKELKNPRIIFIKDKKNIPFYLIYTDDGFYHDDEITWSYKCNYDTFDFDKRIRKEKLNKIDVLSKSK